MPNRGRPPKKTAPVDPKWSNGLQDQKRKPTILEAGDFTDKKKPDEKKLKAIAKEVREHDEATNSPETRYERVGDDLALNMDKFMDSIKKASTQPHKHEYTTVVRWISRQTEAGIPVLSASHLRCNCGDEMEREV